MTMTTLDIERGQRKVDSQLAQLKETLLALMELARRAQTIEAHGHYSLAADEIRTLMDQVENEGRTDQ